jgi:hypothetical protein
LVCADVPLGAANAGDVDKFALYQDAVQAPQGDVSWMLRFYREYVGLQVWAIRACIRSSLHMHCCHQQHLPQLSAPILHHSHSSQVSCASQVPLHLREDFCGTAMISATWCKGDVRRTATGEVAGNYQVDRLARK